MYDLNKLIDLRHRLHEHPELSGNEINTMREIQKFITAFSPDEILIKIAANGIAFDYKGNSDGPTVMIRCELDALPIEEANSIPYKSKIKSVAHVCGHDGHMAILCGVAQLLSTKKLKKGRVVLLFQPAEETGEGAFSVINDKVWESIKPDYIFALHNLPGYKKHSIVLSNSNFCAASKGMIIRLKGKTAHAAEPEKGISPAKTVAAIINELSEFVNNERALKRFCLITIVHVNIGEQAFGTSPANAVVMATLRSFEQSDMQIMTDSLKERINTLCEQSLLECSFEFTEEFPAVINNEDCSNIVRTSAEQQKLSVEYLNTPFKWSEDFGHFTGKYNGCLFGLGAGNDHPNLHNELYDFPDELISTGVKVFYSVIDIINNR